MFRKLATIYIIILNWSIQTFGAPNLSDIQDYRDSMIESTNENNYGAVGVALLIFIGICLLYRLKEYLFDRFLSREKQKNWNSAIDLFGGLLMILTMLFSVYLLYKEDNGLGILIMLGIAITSIISIITIHKEGKRKNKKSLEEEIECDIAESDYDNKYNEEY